MIYSYDVITDIISSKINLDKIKVEIESSSISTLLLSVSLNGNSLDVSFSGELTEIYITTLNGIVSSHDGLYIPEVIIKSQKVLNMPFGSKEIEVNGELKKLFQRVHGTSKPAMMNVETTIDFIAPYNHCKITGLDIMGCHLLDKCDIFICDTSTNSYSGLDPDTYGANFPLNQFGFDVNLGKGEFTHQSLYDADLYIGMVVRVIYKEVNGITKTVGINYNLHEVK